MALGDGIGRNKGVAHWSDGRQKDYFAGAESFLKWLLSNEKYSACVIDTDDHCIFNDVGLVEDYHDISIEELLAEFKSSISRSTE